MTKFEKALQTLLRNEPFYAHILLNSVVKWDVVGIPTAAVYLNKSNIITMCFNSEFMDTLTVEEQQSIIKHETLHLVNGHLTSDYESLRKENAKLLNIAMDMTINQYIKDLPKNINVVDINNYNKIYNMKMVCGQTTTYYYNELKRKSEQMQKECEGEIQGESLDDHDQQSQQSDACQNQEQIKGMIESKLQEAVKKAKGDVPQNILNELSKKEKAQLNWKTLLKNFVSNCVSSEKQLTSKKANRRLPFPFMGRKKKRTFKLGVCVDSSGSVSNEELSEFFNEIEDISKHCKSIVIIEANTEVSNVQIITSGKKIDRKRTSCGGTMYQPSITEAMKHNVDAIVFFGDFDSADIPENPKIPFMWVGVGNSEPPGKFGRVIRLGDRK